jgi:hypothetical protein
VKPSPTPTKPRRSLRRRLMGVREVEIIGS